MDTHVYIRIKPYSKNGNDRIIVKKNKDNIIIENPENIISQKDKYIKYNFPNILNFFQTNFCIFQTIKNNIYKNLMIVAYGQTGSGKTHTIIGNKKDKGLMYLNVEYLLEDENVSNINIQTIQLHNFKIYDVLNNNSILTFYELKDSIHYKIAPIKNKITNMIQFRLILNNIRKNIIKGQTKLNNNSSRSHTIFWITYDTKIKKNISLICIDLAGNERLKFNINSNDIVYINKSLFAFKECIRCSHKGIFVPYRQDKLTQILRDFFNRNMTMIFIGTINPSSKCYYDIKDTIEYSLLLLKEKIIKTKYKEKSKIFEKTTNALISPIIKGKKQEYKIPKIPNMSKIPNIPSMPNIENVILRKNKKADRSKSVDNLPSLISGKEYSKFIFKYYDNTTNHRKLYSRESKSSKSININKIEECLDNDIKFLFDFYKKLKRKGTFEEIIKYLKEEKEDHFFYK